MYASAMTLLQRQGGEAGASYLDLAQLIMDQGARSHVGEDPASFFAACYSTSSVGNRDDHLRNHGFIREPTSPAVHS